jgi:hypothetical protein
MGKAQMMADSENWSFSLSNSSLWQYTSAYLKSPDLQLKTKPLREKGDRRIYLGGGCLEEIQMEMILRKQQGTNEIRLLPMSVLSWFPLSPENKFSSARSKCFLVCDPQFSQLSY